MKAFEVYAKEVTEHIHCSNKTKKRIREDIMESLYLRAEETALTDPYVLMGNPKEVAQDFILNLDEIKSSSTLSKSYEYQSDATFMGYPLIHICLNSFKTAKGIIAIGNRSVGFISIGGFSAGVLAFGGISLGIFSFGGLAISALIAMGGLAVGYDMAFGGLAMAYHFSVGGLAIAHDLAIGGQGLAEIVAYQQVTNLQSESIEHLYKIPEQLSAFKVKIEQISPQLGLIKRSLINLFINLR